jgi:hypothetical protein
MKNIIIILKLIAYGLLIPLIVCLLADLGIKMSCKYYWGEEYLLGHAGFKLGMWLLSLTFYLTLVYYTFCVLYKIVKRDSGRYLLLAIFIILPIIEYSISSRYDFRITISFAIFHVTYYALFFIMRFIFNLIILKHLFKNNGQKV